MNLGQIKDFNTYVGVGGPKKILIFFFSYHENIVQDDEKKKFRSL